MAPTQTPCIRIACTLPLSPLLLPGLPSTRPGFPLIQVGSQRAGSGGGPKGRSAPACLPLLPYGSNAIRPSPLRTGHPGPPLASPLGVWGPRPKAAPLSALHRLGPSATLNPRRLASLRQLFFSGLAACSKLTLPTHPWASTKPVELAESRAGPGQGTRSGIFIMARFRQAG